MPNTLKIISIVGARPNFMKIAPFIQAIEAHNRRADEQSDNADQNIHFNGCRDSVCSKSQETLPKIEHLLVHTGQHYDERMSDSFFETLAIPHPDIDLGIGSGTHAEQVGNTMIAFEKTVRQYCPDWVVVVGDVNATCACAITAKKEHIKLAHIEAGLRSFDLEMPEEINRMVTDRLSDLLFTTDEIAVENLCKEGVADDKIALVGNIMIDTLERHRENADRIPLDRIIADNRASDTQKSADKKASSAKPENYALLTMHRPSNVDQAKTLIPIIRFLLDEVCSDIPIIWPIHPRTKKRLAEFGLWEEVTAEDNMILLEPVGYLEMLRLNLGATLMLTDSGGLQEECCVLGTPCMTLRWNTERPVTLQEHGGASILVGNSVGQLQAAYHKLRQHPRSPQRPPLWDGQTAKRIVERMTTPRNNNLKHA